MTDPKKSIQSDGARSDREDEVRDLYSGLLRRAADARRRSDLTNTRSNSEDVDDVVSLNLRAESFESSLERISRSNDAIHDAWQKLDAKFSAAEKFSIAAPVVSKSQPSVDEAGLTAFRLLAGFRMRLQDLVKGWTAAAGPAAGPGLGGMAFAGLRGVSSDDRVGTGDGERKFAPSSSPIKGASWAPKLRWLNLDWADEADTSPLKEAGSVDVFAEQAGQRRHVAANFRPTADGSVDIRHVVVHLSADEAESLAGADVDVAWVSDVDGKAQRLLVVFHADPPRAD